MMIGKIAQNFIETSAKNRSLNICFVAEITFNLPVIQAII